MGDRYTTRYGVPRPRSPIYNPARASLPINLAYPHEQPHLHVVPASRREAGPRSSNSSVINGGTITTTYKVTAEPSRSVRDGSRTRRSTLDNHTRPMVPAIVTTTATPRHRPVVHSSGGIARAGSPMKDPYRSSQEEYIVTPATSRHGGHHNHRKRYSVTMDNADMNRLAQENGRLRIAPVRETGYTGTRARPIHSGSLVRHADTVADDYGDNGYGYTNAQDLVRYDLDNSAPAPQHLRSRRDSFEGGRAGARPLSISGHNDVAPRSYDGRERGPPPSMRGFDKIHGRAPSWDQGSGGTARMPVAPMPPVPPSMSATEPFQRPSAFEPAEPPRRTNSTRVRPSSVYHEHNSRRGPRDDYYEVRDEEPRHTRQHRDAYDDDDVEERGFGIRQERADRIDRPHNRIDRVDGERTERIERPHSRVDRPDRYERSDRVDRNERTERSDRNDRPDKDRSEHKGRDALATGLSLAGAALGINAVKNAARDDRDEREDSDERHERRRERRDRGERESVDLTGRDPKERRHRDDNPSPPPRDSNMPPPPRDAPQDRNRRNRSPTRAESIDNNGRAPRERQPSKDERDSDAERRERHRRRTEAALAGTAAAVDSRSDTSDDPAPRSIHRRRESGAASGFNPKDASDLKALKEQLNAKEAPKPAAEEPSARTPRVSSTKDAREAAEIRSNLKDSDRRPRELLQPTENKQLRVVSPPREKVDDKPVKGILRVPKEKFPEDPSPIREGVAPLKDAKKDGIPPDARWTKISRKLVNPEALELGKERFEARDDFVIVLRVLTREEVQGYAEVTSKLRANREELEEIEALERRRKRRARHEEQKRERERGGETREERIEKERRHHRKERESESSTDSEDEGDRVSDRPKMLEAPKRKTTFEEALMSGGLGNESGAARETVSIPSRRDERRDER